MDSDGPPVTVVLCFIERPIHHLGQKVSQQTEARPEK